MSDTDQGLDLAEASDLELAAFARRYGVAFERLERCREYLKTSAPTHGKFRLLPLEQDEQTGAPPALALRLERDDGAWVELPREFPTEHLLALLEILDEG